MGEFLEKIYSNIRKNTCWWWEEKIDIHFQSSGENWWVKMFNLSISVHGELDCEPAKHGQKSFSNEFQLITQLHMEIQYDHNAVVMKYSI